jgi:hypothetical protein
MLFAIASPIAHEFEFWSCSRQFTIAKVVPIFKLLEKVVAIRLTSFLEFSILFSEVSFNRTEHSMVPTRVLLVGVSGPKKMDVIRIKIITSHAL